MVEINSYKKLLFMLSTISIVSFSILPTIAQQYAYFVVPSGGTVEFPALRWKGVNLSPRDYWDSSHITANDFHRIKSWGLDHVRLSLHWHFVESVDGVYNENYLLQVDKFVNWAQNASLNVIIGMSKANDGGDSWVTWDQFFNNASIRERFYDVWTMLVNRYHSFPNVIGWNPCRVPNHHSINLESRREIWHNIMTPEIVNRIRQIDNESWIAWEPLYALSTEYKEMTPIPDDHILYVFNFYEPDPVTHQGQEYSGNIDDILNDSQFVTALNFSQTYNVQMFVGEFGIKIDNVGGEPPTESRQLWVHHACQAFEENEFSWSYWVFGHARWLFDLLNSDGSERVVVDILKQYT